MKDLQFKVVVFELGNVAFGISIDQVLSIEKMQSVTKMPKMPKHVRGVINLRGTVIPIVDLRLHLVDTSGKDTEDTRIIVVNLEGLSIGLVVDEATDVLDIPSDTVQEVSIRGEEIQNLTRVAKMEKRLLLLVDIEKLLKQMDPNRTLQEITEKLNQEQLQLAE